MATIIEYYETFNIGGLDRWRNRGKVFWQHPWIHWVVVRKAYVEKKGECSIFGDNANITNANTRPSVI